MIKHAPTPKNELIKPTKEPATNMKTSTSNIIMLSPMLKNSERVYKFFCFRMKLKEEWRRESILESSRISPREEEGDFFS